MPHYSFLVSDTVIIPQLFLQFLVNAKKKTTLGSSHLKPLKSIDISRPVRSHIGGVDDLLVIVNLTPNKYWTS